MLGEIAFVVFVGDVGDPIFGETGLTGTVESNLASKPTVGDSGVAKPDELLDVFADSACRPERRVHTIEAGPKLGIVGQDGAGVCRFPVDGGIEDWLG